MKASRDFYAGLGYLAHSLANSDQVVDMEEVNSYGRKLLDAFGHDTMQTTGTRALATFESSVDNKLDAEVAYEKAMSHFKLDKGELARLKDKVVSVLREIAFADNNISEHEQALLNRFEAEA
ncbi:MAG: TerB family tellurite resistance protein [Bacteroidota bacterium]